MPSYLTSALAAASEIAPLDILVRLLAALAGGVLIATLHRKTRHSSDPTSSFFSTLVLLSVLIAMVTQVIGDNVARAFSLAGALSIVRFRTVLRDTEDTAYVIFSVVTGMAAGAKNAWLALLGLVVIGSAAFCLKRFFKNKAGAETEYTLTVRFGLGNELKTLIAKPFADGLARHELLKIGTTRQGTAFEAVFRTRLRLGEAAEEFVQRLNSIEGVHDVQIERRAFDEA